MFVNKRALLIRVTLNASGISTCSKSCLLEFKSAVRIMAIAAAHCAFENFVMERQIELVLDFCVTAQAKLRLVHLQHFDRRETWLLSVCA
jgi:hypothetical protein